MPPSPTSLTACASDRGIYADTICDSYGLQMAKRRHVSMIDLFLAMPYCRTPGLRKQTRSLQNFENGLQRTITGWESIKECCRLTQQCGLEYSWVDTCCIDKTNSAELSEAINSMFAWYEQSQVCFAFLADMDVSLENEANFDSFRGRRWFTRGWTLQEQAAPCEINFYNRTVRHVGSKSTLAVWLSAITSISEDSLCHRRALREACVAQRMSWAARCETSRQEDETYCLLGIFEVIIPLLYGERDQAFRRLQEHIIARSDDESVFAWVSDNDDQPLHCGIMAAAPCQYKKCTQARRIRETARRPAYSLQAPGLKLPIAFTEAHSVRHLFSLSKRIWVTLHCSWKPESRLGNFPLILFAVVQIQLTYVLRKGRYMWTRTGQREAVVNHLFSYASAICMGHKTVMVETWLPQSSAPSETIELSGWPRLFEVASFAVQCWGFASLAHVMSLENTPLHAMDVVTLWATLTWSWHSVALEAPSFTGFTGMHEVYEQIAETFVQEPMMSFTQDVSLGNRYEKHKHDSGSDLWFQYDKLSDPAKQIRLLKLDHGKSQDDPHISGTLMTVDRRTTKPPPYITISYIWGSPNPKRHVTVNGRALEVTSNCWYALRQIRYFSATLAMEVGNDRANSPICWIDAICINQLRGPEEKSAQVARMGDVYGDAHCVAACVGEPGPESRVLFKAVADYARDRAIDNAEAIFEKSEDLMPALRSFFARPYFARLWVVQEISCAIGVYFHSGTERISLRHLFGLVHDLKESTTIPDLSKERWHPFVKSATRSIHSGPVNQDGLSLFDQMQRYGDFQCSDPRDKVYALLALVDQDECYGRELVDVDYSISLQRLAMRVLRSSEERPDGDRWAVRKSRVAFWQAHLLVAYLWPDSDEHAEFLVLRGTQPSPESAITATDPLSRPVLKFLIYEAAVLEKNGYGKLTVPPTTVIDSDDRSERLMERLEVSFNMLLDSRGSDTKLVYSAGIAYAVVPSLTCAGDILVDFGGPYNCCGLVCRQTQPDKSLVIMGQAILHPRYLPQPFRLGAQRAYISVCFDAEDLLAFTIQDSTWMWHKLENRNASSQLPEESKTSVVTKQWEARLSTPVTKYQGSSFALLEQGPKLL